MKQPIRKKRKKIRYKALILKLSDKQHQSLNRYCRVFQLSPNKLIKLALREFMERNVHRIPEPGSDVAKNQLNLFEAQPKKPIQLSILDSLIEGQQVAEE